MAIRSWLSARELHSIFVDICSGRSMVGPLAFMVGQSVGIVFLIRLSQGPGAGSQGYLSSTVVLCTELCKVVISAIVLFKELASSDNPKFAATLQQLCRPARLIRVTVPMVLYTLQNNILYVALANLSGAEYQVTFQLKILSTACCSVVVLGRSLRPQQWAALVVLTIGVILVQWQDAGSDGVKHTGHRFVGLVAILVASATSGLAGVCMEKALKQADSSIWITNLQSSAISSLVSFVIAIAKDGEKIWSGGVFQGWSMLLWSAVLLQGCGGLVIASILKRTDSIVKCFANAISVIISCLVSVVLQEFTVGGRFCLGTILVLDAIFMYSWRESNFKTFSTIALCVPKTSVHFALAFFRSLEDSAKYCTHHAYLRKLS